ncbi:MAG: hypothetical protein WC503_06205 [Candidatus Shapirobacteria bacterium]
MSRCHNQDCSCHQNSSFIFGLIIGLIIAAVVAVVIYKNNRKKVFADLKKYLEKFINSFKPKSQEIIESFPFTQNFNKSSVKKTKHRTPKKSSAIRIPTSEVPKKEVIIPKNLIIADVPRKSATSKPRIFKK